MKLLKMMLSLVAYESSFHNSTLEMKYVSLMVTQMAILTLFNGFGITVLVMCTFISLHAMVMAKRKSIIHLLLPGKFDHKMCYNIILSGNRSQQMVCHEFMTQGERKTENRSGVSTTTGKCFGRSRW